MLHLKPGSTTDKTETSPLEAERQCWKHVPPQLGTITQKLSEQSLAHRCSSSSLHQIDNRHFWKEIKLLARFNPVMKRQNERLERGQFNHITDNIIQNELVSIWDSISSKILRIIVANNNISKYSMLLSWNCTPDISQQKHISVIVCSVKLKVITPQIKAYFLGFLAVPETTGLALLDLISKRLE